MPIYTYRREDGTTFDIKQKFVDAPLTVDPETGQQVTRVVHAAGIIFKGSGFYVNDSKNASRSSINHSASAAKDSPKESGSADSGAADKSDTKVETKTETKSEAKPEKSAAKTTTSSAAAD